MKHKVSWWRLVAVLGTFASGAVWGALWNTNIGTPAVGLIAVMTLLTMFLFTTSVD